jgi:beta-1,4-N-acetylglucosaminyltransferase
MGSENLSGELMGMLERWSDVVKTGSRLVSLVGPAALKICLRCFQISGEQRREREGRKRKEGKEKSDIYSKVPRSASKVTKKELKGEEGPYVYVTVGTTRFDALVAAASSTAFLTAAESVGFKRVLIQYGRGPCPDENSVLGCKLSFYSLKSDISEDVAKAGVVVSHGGAGSIFEALRAKQRHVKIHPHIFGWICLVLWY